MKYSIRAFQIKSINGKNTILIAFKGVMYFKDGRGNSKFVLPWNVQKIELSDASEFPLKFFGFRGRFKLEFEHVDVNTFTWNQSEKWKNITNSKLKNVNYFDFQNSLNFKTSNFKSAIEIKRFYNQIKEIPSMEVPKPKTSFNHQVTYKIPESVLTLKNT